VTQKTEFRPAIKRITSDLQDLDDDIATYAAMNVLRLKAISPEEIRALVPKLRATTSHPSISVRFFSKKALNTVRHHMARYPEFRTELETIRAETMGTSWVELLAHLEEAETEKKLVVLDLLRDVPDPSLASATIDFMERESDTFVIAEAVRVCGMVGDESHISEIEKYLSHSDSRVRSNAAEALDEIGGLQVMKQILPLLDDEDNRVKATVAKLLAKYGEHNVLHALQDMLHSVELWMRESATYALGFVPYREAEDLLLEALLDVNPEVQIKAVSSLKSLRSRRAKEYFETIVRQADGKLSEHAASALGAIAKGAREYDYFDEANRNAETPLAARARQLRKERGKAEHSPQEEPEAEAHPKKPLGFLARMKAKREEERFLNELGEERSLIHNELLLKRSELGKQVLECYQSGDFQLPFLKDLHNDVRKVLYLIDLKEGQKQEIAEEAEKSSFLGFLRESLLRFSKEKQVEHRMGSLQVRLLKKYAEVGAKVAEHFGAESVELMQFRELPGEIQRLEKRLSEIEENFARAVGAGTPPGESTPQESSKEEAPESSEAITPTSPPPVPQEKSSTPE
jgi:HEAT repeat protein